MPQPPPSHEDGSAPASIRLAQELLAAVAAPQMARDRADHVERHRRETIGADRSRGGGGEVDDPAP